MTAARALYALLVVVGAAAAVLSFSALRDLALVCGFSTWLAWLLPVVVDVGATAGAVAWLRPDAGAGRVFGQRLALAMLVVSVAGNALGHGLAAYALAPPWWVVVIVSTVAPAVLFAVVHLIVLVARGEWPPPAVASASPDDDHAAPAEAEDYDGPGTETEEGWRAYAFHLIDNGMGRAQLARELDITPWRARQLIDEHRQARQEAPA